MLVFQGVDFLLHVFVPLSQAEGGCHRVAFLGNAQIDLDNL